MFDAAMFDPEMFETGEAEAEAPVEQPYSVGQHIFKLRAPRWG